ncbi:pepsin/retropepsin-like aspartic protease family protein [Pontimicrobium aquaticum]|nr:pepsin/retropepsin-like aspartic protease family protein [Pontimicrobium aquaticum]
MTKIKQTLLYTILFTLLLSCGDTKEINYDIIEEFSNLEHNQSYFTLKNIIDKSKLNLSSDYYKYYNGLIYNVFNDAKKSNKYFKSLIEKPNSLPDSLMKNVYYRTVANHFSLFEYKKAYQNQKILVEKYSNYIDSLTLVDAKKNLGMYDALKNVEKQRLIKNKDVLIKFKKDKAGLSNLEVNSGLKKVDFIFDTGASISVIQESQAIELGFNILNVDIDATAITGKKIKSKLAIAKEIRINNLTIQNVIFLVFKDKDLSFPSANYYIKGIIGYPVIRAMEEIHLTNNNELFIPKKTNLYPNKNLAIDERTPIVEVIYENDSLSFSLDTGASSTILYNSFYEKNKKKIQSIYKLQDFKLVGVGGNEKMKGYILDSLSLNIGGKSAILNNVKLNPEEIGGEGHLDGNLGQDYIKQHQKMIISFKESSVIFK